MGRGARREASRLFYRGEGVAGVGSGGHWMDGRRAAWLPHLGWDQLYTEGEEWKESSLTAPSWVGSAVQRPGMDGKRTA